MPTPKRAGADLHRNEPDPEPAEPSGQPDEQPTETVAAEDLGGDPMPSGGGGSSLIPNISNKRLLIIGGILLVGLFAYYQVQQDGSGSGGDGGDGDDGGDDADFEPDEPEPDDGMPNIERDPNDPLKADEQAIDVIWGDG